MSLNLVICFHIEDPVLLLNFDDFLKQRPECCAGYFGAACHPCPGPFDNACNGIINGKVLYKNIIFLFSKYRMMVFHVVSENDVCLRSKKLLVVSNLHYFLRKHRKTTVKTRV